ncbi:hypothetical protein NIES4106_20920 [Fischerella sp. NIES-4106]|nr:hypothetical protein NIES4106_20920 [Fischerella sp. NIES-4106]
MTTNNKPKDFLLNWRRLRYLVKLVIPHTLTDLILETREVIYTTLTILNNYYSVLRREQQIITHEKLVRKSMSYFQVITF